MANQDKKSPQNPKNPSSKRSSSSPPSRSKVAILSPGFRSAAALAGWDEEALLLASLIVEDTPVRESKHKKRLNSTTNSNRKRRVKREKPDSMPAVVLCLDDEEEEVKKEIDVKKQEVENAVVDTKEKNKGLPCMDRLREELSCAICLEICFEPSTTPCGHSFCKKCLKCAAAKCGKRCPKCRQLISNARSCTVNTVLWNTIQLLFPDEIETRRKSTASTNSHSLDIHNKSPEHESQRVRIRSTRSIPPSSNFVTATQVSQAMERNARSNNAIRRRADHIVSGDALLALRLQREEIMQDFVDAREEPRLALHSARANLRAMVSRVYHIRTRGRY